MIIVTGATGKLGSQIVSRLLETVPAESIGVSVRDVAKAAALADRGVRVRAADFTEPATLVTAFEGADQVLVVSAAIRGGGAFAANTAAIDAAKAAGAARILYTSHQAAAADSLFAPQAVHAATTEHLAQSGVAFTALRNGFYATSLDVHVAAALATGRIAAPADGPVSWTAHHDLADAAVAALTGSLLEGVTPPLTASRALDLDEIAYDLRAITGRAIERVVLSDDEWIAAAIARGLPPMVADFALGMFLAARRGEFDVTDPTLARVIGRATTPVRGVLEQLVTAA